jgi:hypothetical protein
MTRAHIHGAHKPCVAILVVDGFDRRGHWGRYSRTEAIDYPWIDLCLSQITRHSSRWSYEVLLFDNARLKRHAHLFQRHPRVTVYPKPWETAIGRIVDALPHTRISRLVERSHQAALDYLLARVPDACTYVVTLDSDSFPVRDDWLDRLVGNCEAGAEVTGVYRDEMAPKIRPFVHVSCLCARLITLRGLPVSFSRGMTQDVGQNISETLAGMGATIQPLRRTNAINFHYLIGGLYGDIIYHHGAGSRAAGFWTSQDLELDERVRVGLRNAVFTDIEHVVAILRGRTPNDLPIVPISLQQL